MGLFAKFFGGLPLKQIKALAEQGNVAAQSEIGTMYEGAQDNAQAACWYRQAADQGDADAKDKLERIIAGGLPALLQASIQDTYQALPAALRH